MRFSSALLPFTRIRGAVFCPVLAAIIPFRLACIFGWLYGDILQETLPALHASSFRLALPKLYLPASIPAAAS